MKEGDKIRCTKKWDKAFIDPGDTGTIWAMTPLGPIVFFKELQAMPLILVEWHYFDNAFILET